MNFTQIKQHCELQKKLELPDDDTDLTHVYSYSKVDFELAIPILRNILKDSGYITPSKEVFSDKLKTIFSECLRMDHDSFTTFFSNASDGVRYEYDYTQDNLYTDRECFISSLPLLGDLVSFKNDKEYILIPHRDFICLNRYLFNNIKSDLSYLLHEKQQLVKDLVIKYGYTKDTSFNALVMKDYQSGDEDIDDNIGDIIFVRDFRHKLIVRTELLSYIAANTSNQNNSLIKSLESYGYLLANRKDIGVHERHMIIAYIANTFHPFYDLRNQSSPVSWYPATLLYNVSVEDQELITEIKANNYYNLPYLKAAIENLENEAPPPPADNN